MRISTIIDISLVDVPGRPVTVIFTAGCNFDCPYCQNAELIPMDSGEEYTISEIVKRATGHLSQGHCITGGEPTLQRDLLQLLKDLRAAGSEYINLNTNGSVPSVLEKCLPLLDTIWLDVKSTPEKYSTVARSRSNQWTNVKRTIELVLSSDVELWPRTTYAGTLMDPDDIETIMATLSELGFKGKYVVQNYVESQGVRSEEKDSLSVTDIEDIKFLKTHVPEGITLELIWR